MATKRGRPAARSPRRPAGSKRLLEVMTADPECCLATDTVQKAARIMRERDTGIVPVIADEDTRELAGVVTDRDLCLAVILAGTEGRLMEVKECMTAKVITVRPTDLARDAAELMERNQIRRLPVVDANSRLVGMVSMADLLRRGELDSRTTHTVMQKISQPSGQASEPRAESERAMAMHSHNGHDGAPAST